MAVNLRELADSILPITMGASGPWGLPIDCTPPDGETFSTEGQLLFDAVEIDPDTGEVMAVTNPIAVLHRSSLDQIPTDGEKWFFQMPMEPSRTATKVSFVFNEDQALLPGGRSLGIIRVPLTFSESP